LVDLNFERGDASRPIGHAFLYFAHGSDQDQEVQATYLIVPPVAIEFSKYVPPLLASSLGASGLMAQTTFLPIPPFPEAIRLDVLRRLARLRGDDVLMERTGPMQDAASLMGRVAEIGEAYARAYQGGLDSADEPERTDEPERADQDQDSMNGLAVLYSMLSEHERIEEIARKVGTLRYAVEGGDPALVQITRAEIRAVGAYLPATYRVDELVASASRPGPVGERLAQLYVDRGYKLCDANFSAMRAIDEEIASLQPETPA
jgi:hypothetical protein